MARSLADVFVEVKPETRQFEPTVKRDLSKVNLSAAGDKAGESFMGGMVKRVAAVAGGLLIGQKIASTFTSAVSGASDLNETLNKSNVIFGQNAAVVTNWARNSARQFGLTRGEALETAAGFGNMFQQLGFAGDQAVKMSTGVVKLATDLGSFNNLPTAEVADMIAASFRGEYDSLQRLIPNINAARVQQEAMAMTGKTNAQSLTAQEKAAATLAIITRDGAAALDDFAETSDGLANRQKILSATWGDMKTALGQALLPVINRGAGALLSFLEGMQSGEGIGGRFVGMIKNAGEGVKVFISAFLGRSTIDQFSGGLRTVHDVASKVRGVFDVLVTSVVGVYKAVAASVGFLREYEVVAYILAGAITAVVVATKAHNAVLAVQAAGGLMAYLVKNIPIITSATKAWAAIQWVLNGALSANPIAIVVLALAGLVTAVVLAYRNSETFRDVVQSAWAVIAGAISGAWNAVIKPALAALAGFITGTLAPAAQWLWRNVIQPAFAGIAEAVRVAWSFIKPVLDLWVAILFNVVGPAVLWLWRNVIRPAFEGIGAVIGWAWSNIIRPVLEALGNFIGSTVAPAFRRGVDAIAAAWNLIRDAARRPVNFIIGTVYNDGIRALFNKVAHAVGSGTRLPEIPLLARGGYARPGLAVVGEEGPELVDFKTPGRVYTARQTREMLEGGEDAAGWGWGGPVDSIKDWVLGQLQKVANLAARPLRALLNKVGGGDFGELLKAAGNRAIDSIVGFAKQKDDEEGTGRAIPGNGTGSQASLVAFGRMLQSLKFRVSEHPAFGGVTGGHARGSRHYVGRAIDVNWAAGTSLAEQRKIDQIVPFAASYGLRTIWRQPGHFNHAHFDYDQGGWMRSGEFGANRSGRPEAVLDPDESAAFVELVKSLRGRRLSGDTVNLYTPDIPAALRAWDEHQARQEALYG